MKRRVAQVPAWETGLILIEWIAGQTEPVTLTHIAKGLALGFPEVQRPVACLEDFLGNIDFPQDYDSWRGADWPILAVEVRATSVGAILKRTALFASTFHSSSTALSMRK